MGVQLISRWVRLNELFLVAYLSSLLEIGRVSIDHGGSDQGVTGLMCDTLVN